MLLSVGCNHTLLQQLNTTLVDTLCKELYDSEIGKVHEKWEELKHNYRDVLAMADCANGSRLHFSVKLTVSAIKIANQLLCSEQVNLWAETMANASTNAAGLSFVIKQELKEKMDQANLFDEKPIELIHGLDQEQIELINEFVKQFTQKAGMKNKENETIEDARALILDKLSCKGYFLQQLRANLTIEVNLPLFKYRELITLFKYIVAMLNDFQHLYPALYDMLYAASRISCQRQRLINQLGKNVEYWRCISLWDNLIDYMQGVKVPKKEELSEQWPRSTARSLKLIEFHNMFDVICQVNHFMAGLMIEEYFVFEYILDVGARYQLSAQHIRRLMQHHYYNKITITNKLSSKKKHIPTLSTELAAVCTAIALPFLQLTPKLTQLLLVSKGWYRVIRPQLFKRYLILNTIQPLPRSSLYLAACGPGVSANVYERMRGQLPPFIDCSEIIALDVRRSLSWNHSLRPLMQDILVMFAYYHPDVGYLQGMNYLCQLILRLKGPAHTAYSLFQYVMMHQFDQLYTGNFEALKLKIYQFMRLVERHQPRLHLHLKTQKLEGEHFLLPWAITLWGETNGYLSWVLWDGFVVQGWKWWFKTVLWLLSVLEDKLLGCSFEDLMRCFSGLHENILNANAQELIALGIDARSVKKQIQAIQIQEELLEDMEKEHFLKVQTINTFMKRVPLPK